MSWVDLVLPGPAKSAAAPVIVSCNKAGRFSQRLRITIRTDLVEGDLPWWRPDAWVRVQTGAGEHTGMLRITPGMGAEGPKQQIGKTGGKVAVASLTLRGFPGLPGAAQTGAVVEFDHSEDWLELTLPSWIKRADAPAKATSLADKVAARAKSAPFVGLGSTGHTETFAGRRGNGPVPGGGR